MEYNKTYKNPWDMIGLASDVATLGTDHENGSTFLAVDTGDLYIFYNDKWYRL